MPVSPAINTPTTCNMHKQLMFPYFLCQAIKMSDSLIKRSPLPEDIQVPQSNITEPLTKEEETHARVCGVCV